MSTTPHMDIKQVNNVKRQSQQSSTMNQCRVCLMEGSIPMNDYLVEMINYFTEIGVRQDDLLPKFLCESCHDLVLAAVLLRDIATESDCTLKNQPFKKKSTLNLTSTKSNLLQKLAQHYTIPSGVDNKTKELKIDYVDKKDSDLKFTDEQSDLDVMSCLKCDADFLDPLSFKAHLAVHQSESHKEVMTKKQKEQPAITFDELKVQHTTNINSVIIPKLTELAYESKERIQIQYMEYKTDVRQKQQIVDNLNKKLKQIAVLTESINAEKSPTHVNIKFTCMTNVSRKHNSKIVKKPQLIIYKNKCFFVCNEVQDFHVYAHKHLINRVPEYKSAIENNMTNEHTERTRTNSSQCDLNFTPEDIDSNSSIEQKSNTTIKNKHYLNVKDSTNINEASAKCKNEDDNSVDMTIKNKHYLKVKDFNNINEASAKCKNDEDYSDDTKIKNKHYLKVKDFTNINEASAKCENEDDYSDQRPSTKEPLLLSRIFVNTDDDTEVFNCKECNDDCVSFTSYISHLQTHLREKYPIEVRQWTCKICMNDFKDKQYMHFILHMARHIACRVCNNEKTVEELRSVRQICPQHKKMVYNLNRRRNEAKVLCENCGKSFATSDYKKHSFTHKKEMRVQCKLCPFRTTRLGLLNSHIAYRHTEKRRFVCDKCEKSFASSGNLGSHMKYAHSTKRYICSVERCKRKCVSQAALNYHVQNEHMGGKEWKCKYCEQQFHKRSGYWRHKLKVHKTSANKGRLPQYLRKDDKEP